MTRRFVDGEHGKLACGFEYRVIRGHKSETDLILQIKGSSNFRHVPMELGFLITDFFVDNEADLFREEYGFKGGRKFIEGLNDTIGRGWRAAARKLKTEREAAEQRRGLW